MGYISQLRQHTGYNSFIYNRAVFLIIYYKSTIYVKVWFLKALSYFFIVVKNERKKKPCHILQCDMYYFLVARKSSWK